MEISEEFIKVYITPRAASLWLYFSPKSCVFCTIVAESGAMCLMLHVHYSEEKYILVFLCCLNKTWPHSLATELCQRDFPPWHPHGEILHNALMPFVLATDFKSSCPSCLDAKRAGTAHPNRVQTLHRDLPSWDCEKSNLLLIAYHCRGFLGHSWKRALLLHLCPCPQTLRK